jgi:hypothetical protein
LLPAHDALRALQQVARGEGLSRRGGVRQQERVEIVDRLGAGELTQREIALLLRDSGFLIGAPALRVGQGRMARRPPRLNLAARYASVSGRALIG